ncbi:MAG: ATP-binding protein [Candidatus Nanopelagicales bacterium]
MADAPYVPEDVFTPKTIVTRAMFERRNEPDADGNPGVQNRLQDALRERGAQVLIFGDTGVGKSSLVKYAAEDETLFAVTVECGSEMKYADILDTIVRKLVDVKATTVKRTVSAESSATGEASVPWFTKLSGTIKGAKGKEQNYEVVEKPVLDVITEVMATAGKSLIVLDNFQNINAQETRNLVAQLMEKLSDRAGDWDKPDIKCVVVGIAEDAASLLGGSLSFARRTVQIGVPRIPDDEIRALLSRGFGLLGLDVHPNLMKQFVFYSDGFPFFAHLIGLYVSRATMRAQTQEVHGAQLNAALTEAAKSVSASYERRIQTAREVGGDVQPRTQIMRILAESTDREWTSAMVQTLWEQRVDKRYDYAFMYVALSQLSKSKFGSILARTGNPRRYRYGFADPHLRPYLRITRVAHDD